MIFSTAVGLVLSFPPFPTGSIALITLVPFLFYLRHRTARHALRTGFFIGLGWGLGTLYWIGRPTLIGLAGAMLWFPLSLTLFALAMSLLHRVWGDFSVWLTPFVWTGFEIIFSWGEMGFTWNSLAYTQTAFPSMIQYASIFGMYGVTFWVVTGNVLLFFLIHRLQQPGGTQSSDKRIGIRFKQISPLLIALCLLLLLPWIHGSMRIRSFDRKRSEEIEIQGADRSVRVALLQGNIDPYRKWSPSFLDSNFTIYENLTRKVVLSQPDLIVWPETAAPCYLRRQVSCMRRVKSHVDRYGIPILTGGLDLEWSEDGDHSVYNSAFLLSPGAHKIPYYSKLKLVPFGERVPLMGTFPILYDLAKRTDLDVGGFSAGDSIVVFSLRRSDHMKAVSFAVVICYESIFPYIVRRFIRRGAQFLVIITNDGWFGNSSGPYQHARIAVMRAVENGIAVARCANTGISEMIDPVGRILVKSKYNEETCLVRDIDLRQPDTPFVKAGSAVPIFILGVNGMILIAGLIHYPQPSRHRTKKKSTKRERQKTDE